MSNPFAGDLDRLEHVTMQVGDVNQAVDWYSKLFRCHVFYQDENWAILKFANTHLALTSARQHRPDVGFISAQAGTFEALKPSNGMRSSVYVNDPAGNGVEILAPGPAVECSGTEETAECSLAA